MAEKNGERIVYDITEIGTPTLSAANAQNASVGHPLLRGSTAHGGIGVSTSANYSSSGGAAQTGSTKAIRPQIRGLYTGSGVDYANRSREGGKDDGPSVKKIGTGEGSHVYGWGLYGSSEKGVADVYTRGGIVGKGAIRIDGRKVSDGGETVESRVARRFAWQSDKGRTPTRKRVLEDTKSELSERQEQIKENEKRGWDSDHIKEWVKELKEDIALLEDESKKIDWVEQGHLYEQTWFTNRAEGDESHLLKWYEPVSEEQREWIADQLVKEGWQRTRDTVHTVNGEEYDSYHKGENERDFENKIDLFKSQKANEVYKNLKELFGTAKAASEFLYRAGIDGVKYPVDSYGKTVKDGDKAGWNYVAFSDEHIRVDHKWTDGQIRYKRLKSELGNDTMRGVEQKRLTEVIRGLETGRLKHPRFTKEEAAASKGTEHGKLWNYILSLESTDVHAGGGQKGASGDGNDVAQGSEGLGQIGRMATRYGSDPRRLVEDSFKYLDEGAESRVYVTDSGKKVLKIRKLSAYDTDGVKDTLSKIIYHNYLFPKDAYTLRDIAVWKNKGHDEFYLILEQPLVTPKTDAKGNIIAPSEAQILEALQKTPMRFKMWDETEGGSGGTSSAEFVQSARKIAYNGDFMVYDFKPGRNTFIDAATGEVRFIDPRVWLNDPGAGFSVSRFGRRNANGAVKSKAEDQYADYTGYEDEDQLSYSAPGSSPAHGIRPQRRLTDAEESEREERALKAVREGRVRVADVPREKGERSEAGAAAGAELMRAQQRAPSDVTVEKPQALSMSQMVGPYRAIRSNPALPRVLQEAKRRGAAWVSRITKGSDVELNPEAFGIIDATDREAVRNGKGHGGTGADSRGEGSA